MSVIPAFITYIRDFWLWKGDGHARHARGRLLADETSPPGR
jgi:hypothetical protein